MKKLTFKPGFEFIFSLSIMAILGLPPIVVAQNPKDLQININNGDTTINGKNIKKLSAKERKKALSDISNINKIPEQGEAIVRRHHIPGRSDDGNVRMEVPGEDTSAIAEGGLRNMRFRFKREIGNDPAFAFNNRLGDDPRNKTILAREIHSEGPERHGMGFNRKNTQNFIYTNTDSQGVSTHVSYHVAEPSGPVSQITGTTETKQLELLDIKDLNLLPQFSEGKTILMFSLPSKTVAEVKLKDSNGNVLWSAKALNGNFSKSFSMGLNGEYYLHVKQGNKMAVKKIFKEQQ